MASFEVERTKAVVQSSNGKRRRTDLGRRIGSSLNDLIGRDQEKRNGKVNLSNDKHTYFHFMQE